MEMTVRTNDLAVFSFMLKLVKCKKAAAFAQLDGQPPAQVCQTADGMELRFGDEKLEAEIERKMTPSARAALTAILGRVNAVEAKDAAGLLQEAKKSAREDNGDVDGDDDDDDS